MDKVKLGLNFFDERFGGVYRNRPLLCCGRDKSGKSILAYHFINQALEDGDRVLLLSRFNPQDAIIVAESLGMPFRDGVNSGQISILEYKNFILQDATDANVMLPPQSFMEMQEIIESQAIRRLVLDTVLPWVAIQPTSRIAEHVYSFIHAMARLDVTTLLTLPKPRSTPAFALKARLEDHCPIVINLDIVGEREWTLKLVKHLGFRGHADMLFRFDIVTGKGMVELERQKNAGNGRKPHPPQTPGPPSHDADQPIDFSSVIRFPE